MVQTKVSHVVQEAIVVIKDVFRKYPNKYESVIGTLCENLESPDSLQAPEVSPSVLALPPCLKCPGGVRGRFLGGVALCELSRCASLGVWEVCLNVRGVALACEAVVLAVCLIAFEAVLCDRPRRA